MKKSQNRHAALNLPRNRDGSGRNKSQAYKREYQEHCRVQRTAGLVTDSRGNWCAPSALGWNASDARVRATTSK